MKRLLVALMLSTSALAMPSMADIIKFGTEASYEPFEFLDENNQVIGFDIDLANALCKVMAVECTFTIQTFDSLIPSLQARRLDAAIASFDVTPEREKHVLFSDTYYKNQAQFIVATDSTFTDNDTLNNKKIGVQNGTSHQKYLIEKMPQATVVSYDSFRNAVLDLKSGRVDAVFLDADVANRWVSKDDSIKTLPDIVTDPAYFGNGLAIAINSRNKTLQSNINNALIKIRQDGTYDEIYKKWFN